MHSMKVLPALAAIAAPVAYAQSSCSETLTITDAAQATDISCSELGGIEVDSEISNDLEITGPETIKGDFTITNASSLTGLSSRTLASIEGKFELGSLESLRSLEFPNLNSIGEIDWTHLNLLRSPQLGESGIAEVDNVRISDTGISSLDDFNIASVDTMIITNNQGLQSYDTQLANISTRLELDSNGLNETGINVTMANLIWATEIIVSDVASFEVPSLEYVNKSLRFNRNYFTSFSAPNLTEAEEDIAFIHNDALTNVSFPLLETLGGSLNIVNNTQLETVDGFPELEDVGGAVQLGGSFEEVEFPNIGRVLGTFTLHSTSDDLDCSDFESMEGDEVDGDVSCRGGDENANNLNVDEDGSGSGSSNSDDDDDAAGIASVNVAILGAMALFGVVAQL